MLQTVLLVLLIIVSLAMTGLVLLQRSEGGALGIGGGSGQFMTARGAGNILTKGTQILGALFFVLCLSITFVAARQSGVESLTKQLDTLKIDPNAIQAPPPPAQPTAPPAFGVPAAPAPAQGLPTTPGVPAAPAGLPFAPAPQ